MTLTTTTRNADLQDMVDLLRDQHGRKLDIVAPATKIRMEHGVLVIDGVEPQLSDDGVTSRDGYYLPTRVCDEGIAEKLGIPLVYVRKLREHRPDILDKNVNSWLHGGEWGESTTVLRHATPDQRSFLVRCFRGDGNIGVGRALLSDQYAINDNLDVLSAVLDGVRKAGVEVEIDGCDLSDRRMYVRISCPQVQALAPTLLAGYRSPFTGAYGADNPVVFAGFVASNSEVGSGAFTITPRIIVQVCNNGMTVSKDTMRAVHLGSRMDEGVVSWSQDTVEKNAALVTAKARDAVSAFLDQDYLQRQVDGIEERAGRKVDHPQDTITEVSRRMRYTEAQQDGIFEHFIKGASLTAGGVLGAVTSYAQTVSDADEAAELEASALTALDEAVRVSA